MKRFLAFLLLFLYIQTAFSQINTPVNVSENLQIFSLTDKIFVHVSFSDSQWGRIASNGVILVDDGKAFLFDTPMDEATTRDLNKYINDSLKATITHFIPNHWHTDCIGGLAYLHSLGVKSYANKLTIELAKKNGYEAPQNSFTDSLKLNFGHQQVSCYFLGAAHSMDNIVVWFPNDNILFAGCMMKEMQSGSMGNTVDGDLKAWPVTIKRVMDKFPSAQVVIPGHGRFGGFELIKHTLELSLTHSK